MDAMDLEFLLVVTKNFVKQLISVAKISEIDLASPYLKVKAAERK